MDNDEIVKRLIDAKAIDFGAMAKVFGELGPTLATSGGLQGILVGKLNIIACFLPADMRVPSMIGELGNLANVGAAISERQ